MATTNVISEALKLIDVKKENLRKAFEDLQSQSSSLSSFSISWSELDSFFTSQQSSLEHKLQLLESQSDQQQPDSAAVSSRLELKSICWNMDGLGLRRYISRHPPEHLDPIRAELHDALLYAPNAAKMVLDGMKGFYPSSQVFNRGNNELLRLRTLRRSCLVMLEGLIGLKTVIKPEVRERAMNLALEWKAKFDGSNTLMALGFLTLVGAYGLVDGFNMGELIDIAFGIAKHRQAVKLCRLLDFGDNMSDLIKKLISSGKQALAVKFIFEFELTDKFPAEPLLENYVKQLNMARVHTGGKMKATGRRILNELKSIMKYVQDGKSSSDYLKENVANLIEKLENVKEKDAMAKEAKKRHAAAPAAQPQKQFKFHKQTGKNVLQTIAKTGPVAIENSVAAASSVVPPFQQPHPPPSGKLADRPAPNTSFPAGPHGLRGSTPVVAPYRSSPVVDAYGSAHALAPSSLTPAIAPYVPVPSVVHNGSAPLGAPYGSTPAVNPYGSNPPVAPYGSTPPVAPYHPTPVAPHRPTPPVAPYGPTPSAAQYGSAPAGAPYRPPPPVAQYNSTPAGAPYHPPPPVAPHGSAPAGAPYHPPPPVAPHGSAPAGAPYHPHPPVAPHGSAPASAPYHPPPPVAPHGSAPTGAPYRPTPPVAPYGSAPAGAPYRPPPSADSSYHPTPPVATYGSSPAVAPHRPTPPGAPYGSTPPGAPYGSIPGSTPPIAPYGPPHAASSHAGLFAGAYGVARPVGNPTAQGFHHRT